MTPARTSSKPFRPNPHHPRLLRIANAIVETADRILAAMAPSPAPDDRDPLTRAIGRRTNDRIKLWRLCDHSACGRAGRCRGLPHGCLARLAPRLTTAELLAARQWLQRRAKNPSNFIDRAA